MVLQGDLPLTKSARIEIRPNGILGDKHVEIITGDPRDPPLRSGEQILVVDDRASVDRLISEVSKITKSLSTVAENIKSATEGDTDKPLGRIISNIEQLTGDLASLSKDKKGEISEIVDQVHSITTSLDELVNDEGGEGIKSAIKQSLARLDTTMKNVEEISGKLNRGEGTLGKLINDEKTVEGLNSAIEGINGFIDAGNKLSTAIDYHSNYLTNGQGAKSYLSIRLQPGLDRFYEVGVVDDPRGVTESTTTQLNTDGTQSTIREQKRYESRLKFNALFGKNFYDFTVKGGIIENSGGIAFDYNLFKRKLRLSLEAFDFSDFNLRASARFNVFHGIYVTGGGEDLASKRASAFVGAGLFLTNDDLKLLLSKMPF
jgi:phospholipid/cholesterol/gamma-HCH transport system substrate-binding protein